MVFHSIARDRERYYQKQSELKGEAIKTPNGMSFWEFEQVNHFSIEGPTEDSYQRLEGFRFNT